jgi:hypothetical protein
MVMLVVSSGISGDVNQMDGWVSFKEDELFDKISQ